MMGDGFSSVGEASYSTALRVYSGLALPTSSAQIAQKYHVAQGLCPKKFTSLKHWVRRACSG